MKLCGQTREHYPHCTNCNAPVTPLASHLDEQVITALNCGNCRTAEFICADVAGWDKLDYSDIVKINNHAIEIARENADRCYFDMACKNKPIDAHSIPQNWIEFIESPHAFIFHRRFPPNHDPSKQPPIPRKVSSRVASTSRFVCDPHDKLFYDSRGYLTEADREPLNMLLFRAVLQRQHNEVFQDNFSQSVGGMLAWLSGISYPDEALRSITFASNSIRDYKDDLAHDYRFVHLVKYLPGKPAVACSNAGMWMVDSYGDPLTNKSVDVPMLFPVAWGITVIPTSTDRFAGHIVVEHYCSLIPDRGYARFIVEFIKGKIKLISSLEGEEAEQLISANILGLTEMLCISSEQWGTFSSEKKGLIRHVWENEMGIQYKRIGRMQPLTQEYDLVQLNLFR